MDPVQQPSKKVGLLNRLSFFSFISTIILLPIFFIPGTTVSLDIAKGFIIVLGVSLSFLFWLIARLVDGVFTIPRTPLITSLLALVGVFFISGLFSKAPYKSIFGQGFEIGTAISMLTMFLVFFLSAVHFQIESRIKKLFSGLFITFSLAIICTAIMAFFGDKSVVANFFAPVAGGSMIGGWNDFAILAGLVAILSLLGLQFLETKRFSKIGLSSGLVLSILVLGIINFTSVWYVLGTIALIVFVYSLSIATPSEGSLNPNEKQLPLAPFFVVLACLFFLLGNNLVSDFVSNKIGFSNTEVRPSLVTTLQVGGKSLIKNPLRFVVGAGPNRFSQMWAENRPMDLNQTIFWDTRFGSGFGLVPSLMLTTGLIGIVAFTWFLLVFFVTGFRTIIRSLKDRDSGFMLIGTFCSALYLWIFAIIYVPSLSLFGMAFVMTGLFVAILVKRKLLPLHDFSYLNDPRNSFFAILAIIVSVMITVSAVYLIIGRYASIASFSSTNKAKDLNEAEYKIVRAIRLSDKNDIYYRTLSDLYLSKLNNLLSENKDNLKSVESELQGTYSNAEASARQSTVIDGSDILNWLQLGKVYETGVALQNKESYELAKGAYEQAKLLSKNNPSLTLSLAQLEKTNKNNEGAITLAKEALSLKGDYVNAYYFLAAISFENNNKQEGFDYLNQATRTNSNDPNVFFTVGATKYNQQNYEGAVIDLEKAVRLAPSSLDARYILALAYNKAGQKNDAITQLEFILKIAPDSETITKALNEIKGGVSSTVETVDTTTDTANTAVAEDDKKTTTKKR